MRPLTHGGSVHFSRETPKEPVHLALMGRLRVVHGNLEVRETMRQVEPEGGGRGEGGGGRGEGEGGGGRGEGGRGGGKTRKTGEDKIMHTLEA